MVTGQRIKGIGYAGTSLALGAEMQMLFIYNNSGIKNAAKAVITFSDGRDSITIQKSEFKKYTSTRSYIAITGLDYTDGDVMVTITMYKADGTKLGTATTDGIAAYCARATSGTALYDSLIALCDSAEAYLK